MTQYFFLGKGIIVHGLMSSTCLLRLMSHSMFTTLIFYDKKCIVLSTFAIDGLITSFIKLSVYVCIIWLNVIMKFCLVEVNSKRVQIVVQIWPAVILEFPFLRETGGRIILYVCAKLLWSETRQLMRWKFSNYADKLIPCVVMKSFSGVDRFLKVSSFTEVTFSQPLENIFFAKLTKKK